MRELVLLHDGQINVTSEVGAGTEFTIYLRAQPSTATQRCVVVTSGA